MLITKAASIYEREKSISAVCKTLHISDWKAIKLLISAGIYPTPMAVKVKVLREQQHTDTEICAILNITKNSLQKYSPYKKCIYNDALTLNAVRIRTSRARRRKKSEYK